MSFPGSFSSQLSSIMEALLKAVVAEVTALVEDGAVELRLELRDRERQILEKERDIEERDRVIEELRAAVEELTARGEEDRGEQAEGCDWTKDEEDSKPVLKSEPAEEEFPSVSTDPPVSLWPLPPLSTATDTADTAAACSFDARQDATAGYSQYPQETEDFPPMNQASLPVDTFLLGNQEPFYSRDQSRYSLMPHSSQLHVGVSNKNMKRTIINAKKRSTGNFRCDQCGKTFTAKCRLISHQSVHTGAKLYSCKKCGKRFTRSDNCVRHEKSDPRCKNSSEK